MGENLFLPFLTSNMINELAKEEEDIVLKIFTHLCNNTEIKDSDERGGSISSLNIILDRVAYFPVRPADMKVNLPYLFLFIIKIFLY